MWFLFRKSSLKHQIGKTTSESLLPLCPIYSLQLKSGQILHVEALWTEEEKKSSPFLSHPTQQCPTHPPKVFSVWDFLQWYQNIWLVCLEARKHLIFFSDLRTMSSLKKKKKFPVDILTQKSLFCFLDVVQLCLKKKENNYFLPDGIS